MVKFDYRHKSISKWLTWTLPFITVAIAAAIRFSLEPLLGSTIPYGLFFLAITVTALFGGFLPGILSTFISAVAVAYLFIAPQYSFHTTDPNNLVALGLFLIVGTTISALGHLTKRAQREAQASAERFRTLADSMPQIVWASRPDGYIDYYNRKWYELTGAKEGKGGDPGWLPVMHPDDRQKCLDLWYESVRVGKPYQNEYRFKFPQSGEYRWYLGRALPVRNDQGQIVRWYGTSTDIHDFKQMEAALRHSERNYRIVADNTDSWEFWMSPDGQFLYNSPSCERTTGYRPDEFTADPELFERIIYHEDKGSFEGLRETSSEEGHLIKEAEFRILRRDGALRWMQHICRPAYDVDGTYLGIRGSNRDITDRKIAKEQQERLAAIVASSDDAIISTDLDGVIMSWNAGAERMLGYQPEQIIGQAVTVLVPQERLGEEKQILAQIRNGEQTEHLETVRLSKDGRPIQVSVTVSPIKNQKNQIVGASKIIHDITDRKQAEQNRVELEAQVQRAHKLESIGILAGGIAHDFNNLLAGLFGYVEVARMYTQGGFIDKTTATLSNALDVIERAKSLTQQLLTFSKGGGPARKVSDITQPLKEAAVLALGGSTVQASFQLPEELWACNIDSNQMSQVFNNILLNAKEAMPGGGIVSISGENISEQSSLPASIPPENYIRISIQDQGHGIPANALEHIFDPFFTTKESGHGLGLSIAYSIVKRHGGLIQVESKVNKGTTVNVYLPASHESGVATTVNEASFHPPSLVRGKILLMDDELIIQEVVSATLNEIGFTVELASNGEEAIGLYKEAHTSTPFDVVILDLTIQAGLGGKDTIKKLLEIDPAVKAVVTSGYSNDPIMAEPEAYGFKAALTKPFQSKDLYQILDKIMGNKDSDWLKAAI